MTNTFSALALIYLQRTILFCLGLASCLPLTTKILTIWIIRLLCSRPKMNTHHLPQHAQSHVASVLNGHLTSKPSTSITQFSSPSTQVPKLAWSSLLQPVPSARPSRSLPSKFASRRSDSFSCSWWNSPHLIPCWQTSRSWRPRCRWLRCRRPCRHTLSYCQRDLCLPC